MLTALPGYPPCSLPGPAHLQQTPTAGPKGASPAHESTASLTKLEKSWSLMRRFTFWNWSKSPLPFSVHRSHMLPAASAFIQADSCTRETQSDEPSLLPRRGSQGSPDLSAGLRQEPWPEALQGHTTQTGGTVHGEPHGLGTQTDSPGHAAGRGKGPG